jgi:hypothetical protein
MDDPGFDFQQGLKLFLDNIESSSVINPLSYLGEPGDIYLV